VRSCPPALFVAACAVVALVPGCEYPGVDDGAIACGTAGCPDDLVCAFDGFCYRDPPPGPQPELPPFDPAVDPTDDARRCPVVEPIDPCASIRALPAPARIDGVRDCGVAPTTVTPRGWRGPGEPPFDQGE
jgi:hypothetical protein